MPLVIRQHAASQMERIRREPPVISVHGLFSTEEAAELVSATLLETRACKQAAEFCKANLRVVDSTRDRR
jgi:hypothetical protein